MGRLTKAGFAAAKRELGLKGKLTRKQVQKVFKKAIKKLGRTQRRVSRTGKVYYTKPKRRVKRRMARRRRNPNRRKGGKSLQQTIFKWLRVGALVAPAAYDLMRPTTPQGKVTFMIESYTGYNIDKGKWDARWMARGWTPFLLTCLATYGIPKLVGIIRRI